MVLPWNLEAELTEQLAYIAEWGGQLVFPLPTLHVVRSDSRRNWRKTMKVVLFCGGYGMRMRNSADDSMPKPMQMVGPRPLIWHVMRYYAHFGHTEFILCLGYGASHIKNYFLTYQEAVSNDFVIRDGQVELMHSDISDWSITFVDTGLGVADRGAAAPGAAVSGRRRVLPGQLRRRADRRADGPDHRRGSTQSGAAASMMIVPPQSSFHCVEVSEAGEVKDITPCRKLPIWENGGFFVLSQEVLRPAARGRRSGRGRLRRRWPRRAGCSATSTTASGSRPTRSRSAPNSTPGTTRRPAVDALGRRGEGRSPSGPDDSTRSPATSPRSRCSERIATTSRSAWAARC